MSQEVKPAEETEESIQPRTVPGWVTLVFLAVISVTAALVLGPEIARNAEKSAGGPAIARPPAPVVATTDAPASAADRVASEPGFFEKIPDVPRAISDGASALVEPFMDKRVPGATQRGDVVNLNALLLSEKTAGAKEVKKGMVLLWEQEMSPGDISPRFYGENLHVWVEDPAGDPAHVSEKQDFNTFRVRVISGPKRKISILAKTWD